MDEFIVQNRIPVIAFVAAVGMILSAGGLGRRLLGASAGTALGAAAVTVCILLNLTALWWLPADKQALPDYDVPKLLDPLVRPLEQATEYHRQAEAAMVALRYLGRYAVVTLIATAVALLLLVWLEMQFRRDVRAVRVFIKKHPELVKEARG